jgi:hypothetical protein
VIVLKVGELVFGILVDQVATAIVKLGDRLIILIEPNALALAA